MTLPELAIRRPVTTLMILVSLFVVGGIALTRLPLAFMPQFEEPQIWVVAPYQGASPKTTERAVLRPLEDALGSVSGLDHMFSNADEDGARVGLFFDWKEDMAMKRVEVRERIDRARDTLPEDVGDITISRWWDPGRTGETILEGRIAADRDLSHGYDLLYDHMVKPILRVPGVANVDFDGLNPREIRVNLRLNDLARHGVDVRDVLAALRDNNDDKSLGVLRTGETNFLLRAEGKFTSVEQIADLRVGRADVRLNDVADVTYGEPPLEYGRHLDGKFALGIGVAKEASANTIEVTNAVKATIEDLENDPELEGIQFLIWEDQGSEILSTIGDLRNTGILGAILASIVLFLFLKRWSSTFFAVACIPFSLIVACGVIWAKGGTLNTVTLLGLIVGIGMLVDNAVVVMENINRYHEKGVSPRAAALLGSREVSVAVIAATLTSVIVFLPIIFSEPNEMNLIFRELGLTVCFTLIASLFVSQTLIPLAMSRFIRPKVRQPGRWMTALSSGYSRILAWTIERDLPHWKKNWWKPWKRPALVPLLGTLLIASAVWPIKHIEFNLEPSEVEMFVTVRYNLAQPMSLDKKEELVTRVEKSLQPHQEELHIGSLYSFWSEGWVMTRCYMADGYTSEVHMNEVRKQLKDIVPEIAGVKLEVQDNVPFWQRNRGNRLGFQLTGEDTEALARLSEDAKRLLETVPGLYEHYSSAEGGRFEVQTRVDRDRAREYGVGVEQAADVVELTFRGRRLPRYVDGDREVEMNLTLDEQDDESLSQLENLPLLQEASNVGSPIPLSAVADFRVTRGPDQVQRDDRVTGVWVGARFDEGDKDAYVAQCKELLSGMDLPYGYRWDFSMTRREQQDNAREAQLNLLLALGLIFAVIAGLFESVRQALSLMISLPFAIAGAAWTLYFTGTRFDAPAFIGVLLLLGIVVNNGIVLIEHINGYRRRGVSRETSMVTGGGERLRPVLMTTVTTLLGLLPIVIQKPSLAGVYYYSMAFVIMGGLALSTVATMLALPFTVCVTEDLLGVVGRGFRHAGRWILSPFGAGRKRQAAES
ncbi:MAG: efflux RND transporter permease subunit [bacterium]